MDDNVLYPSPFTLFLICGEKGLSMCLSTEEISARRVIRIEMGERAPVAALPVKGHGISWFSFLTTLIHPPHSLPSHLCRETLL